MGNTEKDAKYYRDKHVLETVPKLVSDDPIDRNTAIIVTGVSPENYDKIKEEKRYSDDERFLIRNVLEDELLFSRITELEFNKKIKGELKSRKAIFLSLCSIWINEEIPINTFVSSESSAGKSYICKKVAEIFPKEMVQYRTKITPEVFTYWHAYDKNWTWDGKICYLEDISQPILDSATFKVMCSEGSTASVLIKQKVVDIEIKGKPAMLVTTAETNPRNEILNRFSIIPLDETEKQSEDIIFAQAEQSETGKREAYDQDVVDALKLLERKYVIIPYAVRIAQHIKRTYDFGTLRIRRDFLRLLGLIKASTALHQFQREKEKEDKIIANKQDYEIARECINYFQSNTLLSLTHKLAKAYACCLTLEEFTAKEIHSKFPIVNQKMWYIYLDKLAERKLLVTDLKNVEEVKQRVKYYKVAKKISFQLPEFEELFIEEAEVVQDGEN